MNETISKPVKHPDTLQDNMLFNYTGQFDNSILAGIGSYIKDVLRANPQICYKLFSIFVELTQNIYYHAEPCYSETYQKLVKLGSLSIEEFVNYYTISATNMIKNDNIDNIKEQCIKINQLDNKGLRKLKKDKRKIERSEHGHANIGLIQIAITSDNPIDIKIKTIDAKFSKITIITNIDKESLELISKN